MHKAPGMRGSTKQTKKRRTEEHEIKEVILPTPVTKSDLLLLNLRSCSNESLNPEKENLDLAS